MKRRGPNTTFGHQPFEGGEVALLLLRHVANGRRIGTAAEYGELPLIDAPGAILAGMVDTDDALNQLLAR